MCLNDSFASSGTCSKERLFELADSGMNIARLNMSHGDHNSHKEVVDLIKEYNKLGRNNVAIVLDTKVIPRPNKLPPFAYEVYKRLFQVYLPLKVSCT